MSRPGTTPRGRARGHTHDENDTSPRRRTGPVSDVADVVAEAGGRDGTAAGAVGGRRPADAARPARPSHPGGPGHRSADTRAGAGRGRRVPHPPGAAHLPRGGGLRRGRGPRRPRGDRRSRRGRPGRHGRRPGDAGARWPIGAEGGRVPRRRPPPRDRADGVRLDLGGGNGARPGRGRVPRKARHARVAPRGRGDGAAGVTGPNPKSEARNPKQIQSTKKKAQN